MATNINELITSVDRTFAQEIKKAQEDYKERIEAIDSIYDMPDIIIQAGGVSRKALAEGGLGEARKACSSSARKMKNALDNVLKEMKTFKGKPDNAADIIKLTEKLEEWVNDFSKLEIPASKHTKAESYSVESKYVNALKEWKDYCENDPIIKNAEKERKKAECIAALENDQRKLASLKMDFEKAETEYSEKKASYESDVETVIEDVKKKSVEIDGLIENKETELEEKEDELRQYNSKLSSLGLFGFSEKKRLKLDISNTETAIQGIRQQISDLQKNKEDNMKCKDVRINGLDSVIESLKNKIERLSGEIDALEFSIKKSEELLAKFE